MFRMAKMYRVPSQMILSVSRKDTFTLFTRSGLACSATRYSFAK